MGRLSFAQCIQAVKRISAHVFRAPAAMLASTGEAANLGLCKSRIARRTMSLTETPSPTCALGSTGLSAHFFGLPHGFVWSAFNGRGNQVQGGDVAYTSERRTRVGGHGIVERIAQCLRKLGSLLRLPFLVWPRVVTRLANRLCWVQAQAQQQVLSPVVTWSLVPSSVAQATSRTAVLTPRAVTKQPRGNAPIHSYGSLAAGPRLSGGLFFCPTAGATGRGTI
ncbi:hypothetical protein SAMN05421764_102465 [Donghicola eburneus]|uniref:Uncharacterized protein n=1 Tax=Donghicola eburneus TaxID=393278 RepID=A0A1M4N191_9RHOB|nr:hypothetical protein KARMA_2865 [Donghicola eburneus]SFQ28903.1 hypothetical protein SAMN05421764_102465 [Donghicola eburneus]